VERQRGRRQQLGDRGGDEVSAVGGVEWLQLVGVAAGFDEAGRDTGMDSG